MMDEKKLEALAQAIDKAAVRIKSFVRTTPVEFSPWLTELSGNDDVAVYLKLENEQVTGSFKVRGAMNKMLSHPDISDKVVTASTGNHALAVAHALHTLGGQGKIYLPINVKQGKQKSLERYSRHVELCHAGYDCVDTETTAREAAAREGNVYVSPYNDMDILIGQGTIAAELCQQLTDISTIIVPVGGGGMISGIAAYAKARIPGVCVIGCQPENSAVMKASVEAGEILDIESKNTLADGVAGGVEKDTVTFDICRECVDQWITVTEEEIAWSVYTVLEQHHKVVEGSAGLSIAAYVKLRQSLHGTVVLLMCGGNLDMATLRAIVAEQPACPWPL